MTAGSTPSDDARARANAKFAQSEQRKSEADQAMKAVKAAKVAETAKTARLRALRLAKEESDRDALLYPDRSTAERLGHAPSVHADDLIPTIDTKRPRRTVLRGCIIYKGLS